MHTNIPIKSAARLCAALASVVFAAAAAFASGAGQPWRFPDTGALQFVIEDHINNPVYHWPRTLVSYEVEFGGAAPRLEELALVRQPSGAAVPAQFSEVATRPDGTLSRARVHFFCDLPPGAKRVFELRRRAAGDAGDAAAAAMAALPEDARAFSRGAGGIGGGTIASGGGGAAAGVIEAGTGRLSVRIPGSRVFAPGEPVPAPIMALKRGAGWLGDNRIVGGARTVSRLETVPLAEGGLFHAYRLTYHFSGGARYTVTLRVVAGYDFIECDEEISGLAEADNARVEMRWAGFAPTHRHAAHGVPEGTLTLFHQRAGRWPGFTEPLVTTDWEEDPKWIAPNLEENVFEEMLFRLSPYSGNGVREASPAVSFWNDAPGGEELALFVLDALRWQDGQYMIWQPSTALQVRFRADRETGAPCWTWPLREGSRNTGIALGDAAANQRAADGILRLYEKASAKGDGVFRGGGAALTIGGGAAFPYRYAQAQRAWRGALNLARVMDWVLACPETAAPPLPVEADGAAADPLPPEELVKQARSSVLMTYGSGMNPVVMDIRHRVIRPFADAYRAGGRRLPPEQKKQIDALLLLSAYINAGEDISPARIALAGTPNMAMDSFSTPPIVASLFPDHPMAPVWRDQFGKIAELLHCFHTRPAVPSWGALGGRWTESLGTYNWGYLLPALVGRRHAAAADGVNRMADPWLALRGRWMVEQLTAPVFNPDPYWRQAAKPAPPAPPPAWKPGDKLDPALGFERQYASHGAHGTGTGIVPPWLVAGLAECLARFDPLTAEHLFWARAQVRSKDAGAEWPKHEPASLLENKNPGTRPRLRSSKHTGHGVILRAAVGTPGEVSVHLDQVDAGPNYRWGDNGEGANGTLYYFAQGRVWSGHERENTGDHFSEETLSSTTFGFMKHGKYHGIGAGVLDRPLFDFGCAQFAELAARRGPAAYSWPQYESRSVMLVGADYLVIFDQSPTDGFGRFSWFTARDLPFPKLMFLDPPAARPDHWTEVQTNISKGILRDARGSSLVIVTHKADAVEMEEMNTRDVPPVRSAALKQYAWRNRARAGQGVYFVKTPDSRDSVFRRRLPCEYDEKGDTFAGAAGVIRHRNDGVTELALFKGTAIGAKGVRLDLGPAGGGGASAAASSAGGAGGGAAAGAISTDGGAAAAASSSSASTAAAAATAAISDGGAAVSATFANANPREIAGMVQAAAAVRLRVTLPGGAGADAGTLRWWLDGAAIAFQKNAGALEAVIPPGRHRWEITARLPQPDAPEVLRTVNRAGGASVHFAPVAGAESYRAETSRDGGATWRDAGDAAAPPLELDGLAPGKLHVRLLALNRDRRSGPGADYPVYVDNAPPPPPDGVSVILSDGAAEIRWGEVLGAGEYRLYRRRPGGAWERIHAGPERSHTVRDAALRAPDALPRDAPAPAAAAAAAAAVSAPSPAAASSPAASPAPAADGFTEYAVACANGNGEGAKSAAVNTDPADWKNWWPSGQPRAFKRHTAYWLPPYVSRDRVTPPRYPE
ncbi:MAG: hypothetical protein LBC18_04795 [Opitutaceae bacterium]|jgi:hypothetical protein|nr:hypothetical protein [Opitutaceae bacterium]